MQDKIQEIMGLVENVVRGEFLQEYASTHEKDEEGRKLASDSRNLIESKLRELVREPLSDEQKEALIKEWSHSSESSGSDFLDGIIYAERAHNITNTSGVA